MGKQAEPSNSSPTSLITNPDKSEVLQVRRAQLRVSVEGDESHAAHIPATGLVVGSSSECGLALSDPAVSRRHFEMRPEERGFRVRDLDSKNGTFVDGLRVGEAFLEGGECITVGHTTLRLTTEQQVDEYPLSPKSTFGTLLGRGIAMRHVFALLERAATSDVTVLLEGESGTGKDLAASAIHQASARRDGPLVVVDCGSIPRDLVESELFGHKKGSFTGAAADRRGAFELAHGGTVFLDEVGELPPEVQPRLLRVLEGREVKPVGGTGYRPVDVRVIGATNRELRGEVAAGRFREDLFYRISVVTVRMPALRDRVEDIPLIARSIVQRSRPDADPLEVISDSLVAMLANHNWPGNVRELRNVVERLLLFPEHPETAISGMATPRSQPSQNADLLHLPFHDARQQWNSRFEKMYLSEILEKNEGVVARAARQAGIPRQTFHRLVSKHKLGRC